MNRRIGIETRHNVTKGANLTMKRLSTLVIGIMALAMVFAVPGFAQDDEVTIQVDVENGSDICEREDFTGGGGVGGFGVAAQQVTACESITRALEIAEPDGPDDDEQGDTIQVAAGTYSDAVETFPLTINTNEDGDVLNGITLQGAGSGAGGVGGFGLGSVRAAQANNNSVIDGTGVDVNAIVEIKSASNVTIDGFQIKGDDGNVSGISIQLADASLADITIQNNEIFGMEEAGGGGTNDFSFGILVFGAGSGATNTIDGLEITDNVIRDLGDGSDSRGVAISLEELTGDGATVTGNSISNLASIDAATPAFGMTVLGEVLNGDTTGDGNVVTDTAIADIDANTFDLSNQGVAIGIGGDVSEASINNNNFTNPDSTAILTTDDSADPQPQRITGTLDAEDNFYGNNTGPATDTNDADFAPNGGGTGALISIADDVDFEPFSDNPTGEAPDPGDVAATGAITQIVLNCDETNSGVSFEITFTSGDPLFGSLSCNELFDQSGEAEDVFDLPENRQFSPNDVEQVNIQYHSRKGFGAPAFDDTNAFIQGILDGDNLERDFSYILQTNSDDSVNNPALSADLNDNGDFTDDFGGVTSFINFDPSGQSKQPTLRFETEGGDGGGGVGGFSAEANEPSVQPLSVNGLQTSQLGPNYTFSVQGQGVASTSLQVFDLSGRSVANETSSGSTLRFRPMASNGAPLANGIYLYQVTVRGHDGTVKSMGVRKMLVLR